MTAGQKALDLYYAQKDGCKKHHPSSGKICVECVAEAFAHIEKLLCFGMPGHHVLRLIGNGDISAGKGRELILGVLFGNLTFDDLPMLNADTVLPDDAEVRELAIELAAEVLEGTEPHHKKETARKLQIALKIK